MADDRVVLAQIIVPPSEDHCFAALCGQNACCTVEIRAEGTHLEREDDHEETVYVLPLCEPHALHVLTAPLERASSLFPPGKIGLPPWDQESGG